MRKFINTLATAMLAMCLSVTAAFGADNFTVEQKYKIFVYNGAKVETLKVKVGDTVEFKNMDPYVHNVYSLSDARQFDLGSYPQGQSKSVTFDKAGKVEVECAIHPGMQMVVEVK
ncbi:MAG: methylamine utilization protein [Acidobacteriia bacterium]|nr:methylamine utilization protein [Terriglobia bacterium]